jgi:hypothetical protein
MVSRGFRQRNPNPDSVASVIATSLPTLSMPDFSQIEAALPFAILGFDIYNGASFATGIWKTTETDWNDQPSCAYVAKSGIIQRDQLLCAHLWPLSRHMLACGECA